jgi:serine/threonine protein kinase
MSEETIFETALSKTEPAERIAYLDAACADDPELRRRIEALLRSHEQAGGLLDRPPVPEPSPQTEPSRNAPSGCGPPSAWPSTEGPGSRIGPYSLIRKVGEGGMGVVFLAEQERPVRRTVALKVIKPGMDSDHVIARLEAERQALALMDHPHIAKFLDAGTTDSGRPYFVMEPVEGRPITEYCDQHRLTPEERLELFVPVCQAIQHAHQKGIIHRDIKPSNVLVSIQDGKPVPKVIDFGIAKAIDQRLTERTLFTHLGAIVGTPQYMSPEQAQMNGLDVDTRSDIYSLGVLLYELLTGTTPLRRQTLQGAAFTEILRRIREEEPPRPSTRLETIEDTVSIAASRRTEPARLARQVRGDLDWIVMKALEKEPARRYETADALARDIVRHLDQRRTGCGSSPASIAECSRPPRGSRRSSSQPRRPAPCLLSAREEPRRRPASTVTPQSTRADPRQKPVAAPRPRRRRL